MRDYYEFLFYSTSLVGILITLGVLFSILPSGLMVMAIVNLICAQLSLDGIKRVDNGGEW